VSLQLADTIIVNICA